jgi:hypothetical protein
VNSSIEIVLIVAAVGYVLVRRMLGEPAEGRRMLLLPAVLAVIGLSDAQGTLNNPVQLGFLVVTVAISVLLGALRGVSIHVSDRDGIVFVRYTVLTIVLWAINLAVKFGANFVLDMVDHADAATLGNTLLLTLGIGMLVEGVTVLGRAMRGTGQIIWSAGKDGAPHQNSEFLDNLRARMNDRRR